MQVVDAGQAPQRLIGVEGRCRAPDGATARRSRCGGRAWRDRSSGAAPVMAEKPHQFRLAITHVPPSRSTSSAWRRIASISSVMLNATMTRRPVRSWMRADARHHRRHALARAAHGPGRAQTSSSLMKSMPASHSSPTSVAGLLGAQADIRLDDGAEQRAGRARRCELARAGDALARPLEASAIGARQAERTAGARRSSRRGRRDCRRRWRPASAGWRRYCRPGNETSTRARRHGPARALPLQPGIGQARRRKRFQLFDAVDGRAGARAQLVGLAVHAREGAAGLLARQHVGRARPDRAASRSGRSRSSRSPCES